MKINKMIARPDLRNARSPESLEIFQLTSEKDIASSHVYMEAQIFAPDSKRFVLHRSADAHGSDRKDPQHQYLLCDLENRGELIAITDEIGARGPAVSPDGKYFYYFVDETEINGGRLLLKRRLLDGTAPEIITVVDAAIPGTSFRPSLISSYSTIRSDGQKIAIQAFLGDGQVTGSFGLLVFDVQSATVELIFHGPWWNNMHPQYSRSRDPQQMRDIMVQHNHDYVRRPDGTRQAVLPGGGPDIHVIRDDGLNLRDMPWGRDGKERCQGHQCWRGRSDWAITGTTLLGMQQCQLIESQPVPHADHRGLHSPGAVRNHVSRDFTNPGFHHFATDIAGKRLITDWRDEKNIDGGHVPITLYLAELGEAGLDAAAFTYLLNPRSPWTAHTHPFLSPDGKTAFFNSSESGILQAYMICGLP